MRLVGVRHHRLRPLQSRPNQARFWPFWHGPLRTLHSWVPVHPEVRGGGALFLPGCRVAAALASVATQHEPSAGALAMACPVGGLTLSHVAYLLNLATKMARRRRAGSTIRP